MTQDYSNIACKQAQIWYKLRAARYPDLASGWQPSDVQVLSLWQVIGNAVSEGLGKAKAHSSQEGDDVWGLHYV